MFPLPSLKAVFVTRDASDKNSLELRSNERKYVIILNYSAMGVTWDRSDEFVTTSQSKRNLAVYRGRQHPCDNGQTSDFGPCLHFFGQDGPVCPTRDLINC